MFCFLRIAKRMHSHTHTHTVKFHYFFIYIAHSSLAYLIVWLSEILQTGHIVYLEYRFTPARVSQGHHFLSQI